MRKPTKDTWRGCIERVAWSLGKTWKRTEEPIQHPYLRPQQYGSGEVIHLYAATEATTAEGAPVTVEQK